MRDDIAIVLFTVLTRLVLLPINVHQQKTTSKSARLQPKIQKIQKKYNVRAVSDARERQKMQAKLNEEMWTDLFLLNGDNLTKEIDNLVENLTKYSEAIKNNDADTLKQLLKEGKESKQTAK